MTEKKKAGQPQMLLVAGFFLGPLMLAALMYYGGSYSAVDGGTNKGALLQPFVNLGEALPASRIHEIVEHQWLMVYSNTGLCGSECESSLLTLRQTRLMLGKEMDRVERVFLHGDTAPDTVFIEEQHTGLKTITDTGLGELLEGKRPVNLDNGGIFLIDPLGNLVMYFPPNLDPKDTVSDIKHLLRLSRIG